MSSVDFNEQIEEIEVLQSIFPTEFTLLSGSEATTSEQHRFKILLEPTTDDSDNHGKLLLITFIVLMIYW